MFMERLLVRPEGLSGQRHTFLINILTNNDDDDDDGDDDDDDDDDNNDGDDDDEEGYSTNIKQ